MKAIMNIIILSLLVCGNVFSQTKSYSWDEIKDCTVCSSGTPEDVQKERHRISKHLKCHAKKFKKRWWKYHILIGKDTKKMVLRNIDYFYVPKYTIAEHLPNMMSLKLSDDCIGYMIFVSDSCYLGCYNPCNCEAMSINKNKCSSTDKLNYVVNIHRYSKADITFAIDFFGKGRPVFSLDNYNEKDVWFSSDGRKPIKFDMYDILRKIVNYDTESNYKKQFYNK